MTSLTLLVVALAAPPDGFEAAWRRAAANFAQQIQPHMSDANKQELQAGLATTDPKPPLERWAGPSTHSSVGRASSMYYVAPAPMSCSRTMALARTHNWNVSPSSRKKW